MESVKKILAPTDLSDLSWDGVRVALEIAQLFGAELIVHYVISYQDEAVPVHHGIEQWVATAEGEEQVRELMEMRRKDLDRHLSSRFSTAFPMAKIRLQVQIGIPYERILETALSEGVDMIVMATHGRSGLGRFLIGSVTEEVIRRATCPVLAVPPSGQAAGT